MRKKKILLLLFILIIIFSMTLIYNVYTNEIGKENKTGGYSSNDVTSDEVMSEIDTVLLDENDDIEIGDLI